MLETALWFIAGLAIGYLIGGIANQIRHNVYDSGPCDADDDWR